MSKENRKVSIGGQALIEGIMMQGPKGAAMSVRLPDGEIETEQLEFKKLKDKFKPAGWPLIRGIVNFVESMLFGFKCIEKSAEKAPCFQKKYGFSLHLIFAFAIIQKLRYVLNQIIYTHSERRHNQCLSSTPSKQKPRLT